MNYCATVLLSLDAWADSEVAALAERRLCEQLEEAGCVEIGPTTWEEMTWFDPMSGGEPHTVMNGYREGRRE
jgi:hypothetical protein